MKILVDENIAFADEAFNAFGTVKTMPGRAIKNSDLQDVDILIVRSVTDVNGDLLKNTPVKFVGTATIGTDHIDLNYLKENKIFFADAIGCNSYAVAEYCITAIFNLIVERNIKLNELSVGIVGVGNIGSIIASYFSVLGSKIVKNDPPLYRKTKSPDFNSLEKALNCDIVTLHVPLTFEGIDKTYHLLNKNNLSLLRSDSILINTSRGAVINNSDLSDIIREKRISAVIDVWENEPIISEELLNLSKFSTAHVAGYTLEGKANGTIMMIQSLNKYLQTNFDYAPMMEKPIDNLFNFEEDKSIEQNLKQIFTKVYDIQKDTIGLKGAIGLDQNKRVSLFDIIRKDYKLRREFNNYSVRMSNKLEKEIDILKKLRFNII